MGAFPQIGGSTKLSVTGNAKCGTGDSATMRPREVKRELIRALAPTAGGLFTGAPWRARSTARHGCGKAEARVAQNGRLPAAGCSRKAAKGAPEQEDRLTDQLYLDRPGLGAGRWFALEICVRVSRASLANLSSLRRAMFSRISTAFFASSCKTTSRCATARRSRFALAAR